MERLADALFFLGTLWFIVELAKLFLLDLPHFRADMRDRGGD